LIVFFILCSSLLLPTYLLADAFDEFGEIQMSFVDNENSASTLRYDFSYLDQKMVQLEFPGGPPKELKGQVFAQIQGQLAQNEAGQEIVTVNNFILFPMAMTEENVVSGTRSALLIRVNFSDATVGCSLQAIKNQMWTGTKSITGLYEESSYGQLSFASDTNNDG